jgi:hypothetical protein
MPSKQEVPEVVKPYLFHGVELGWNSRQAVGDCPWCGREGKFCVDLEKGVWRCYVCGEGSDKGGGNVYTFLHRLWEASYESTKDYKKLASSRGLQPDTLIYWEVVQSALTGDWLVPGHNPEGKLCQLYKYVPYKDRMALLASPGLKHQLFGLPLFNRSASTIYLMEGPWDGMAAWEALGQTKITDKGYQATANQTRSLLADASVLAVPGCNTFLEAWLPLFLEKRMVVIYDSDHPKLIGGRTVPPAGWAGMRRVTTLLAGVAKEVLVKHWGPDGYAPDKPSGYDARDVLADDSLPVPQRVERLLGDVLGPPTAWTPKRVKKAKATTRKGGELECTPCSRYEEVTDSWQRALKWTPGLDHALACMLASISSTPMVGDQLWLKVVGPAACGKSTLCEAVSVNRQYVLAKSTIRGFHSGFKTDGEDSDCSLVSLLPGMTLVTKDGDTLLQSPNLGQILSEGRDIYDGVSRTHYRNNRSKAYEGLRITWILCGTSSLRQIDSSELGERFLDCVVMDGIDDELEDEILNRVVHRATRDMSIESSSEAESQYAPELARAMGLTGGYIDWLRENAAERLALMEYPSWVKRKLTRLGKFTAYMRARPSTKQEEIAEREFATRLVSQLTRLAGCLALVLNKDGVDEEVMRRVKQVALDTSRGRTLLLVKQMYESVDGLESKALALLGSQTEEKTRYLLRFLRAIGVIENHQPLTERGTRGKVLWRLTERMHRLYTEANSEH